MFVLRSMFQVSCYSMTDWSSNHTTSQDQWVTAVITRGSDEQTSRQTRVVPAGIYLVASTRYLLRVRVFVFSCFRSVVLSLGTSPSVISSLVLSTISLYSTYSTTSCSWWLFTLDQCVDPGIQVPGYLILPYSGAFYILWVARTVVEICWLVISRRTCCAAAVLIWT